VGLIVAGQGAYASMNTLEEDLRDDGIDVAGRFDSIDDGLQRYTFSWVIGLSPQLQMGLDADLTRMGSVSVPIASSLPMPKARLTGAVYAGPAGTSGDGFADLSKATLVASIPATPDVDVAAAGSQLFQSTVVPSREADYLAFDPAANLFLVLNVSFERPALLTGPEAPVLQPGGSLTLPLLEYADRIARRSVVADGEPVAGGAAPEGAAKKGAAGLDAGLAALALAAVALGRRRK
jgi:hypothetical protein